MSCLLQQSGMAGDLPWLLQQRRSGSSEGLGALLKGTSASPTGRGLNRQPSSYKSDALTSRPWLPLILVLFVIVFFVI